MTVTERSGALSATGIAKETTFGTAVAATGFLPMSGNTMEYDPSWYSPKLMLGVRDLQVFNLQGEHKYNGTITGSLFPTNGIPLLVAAIGTDAVTGSASPYTHTISQANTLASLTIEKAIGDYQSLQFAGCLVSKLAIKAAAGNSEATISADMVGQSAAILDSPTAISVTNEAPFVFAEATVTLASNARSEVTSIQWNIDNGVKSTYTLGGSADPTFITPLTVHSSGTIDLVFDSLDDSTYGDYTTMSDQTLGSLSLALSHPSSGGSVTLTSGQVVLSKYSNDLKISDVVLSTLTFEASKSLPSGSTISASIVNATEGAY